MIFLYYCRIYTTFYIFALKNSAFWALFCLFGFIAFPDKVFGYLHHVFCRIEAAAALHYRLLRDFGKLVKALLHLGVLQPCRCFFHIINPFFRFILYYPQYRKNNS